MADGTRVSLGELFFGFMRMSLSGFGGVLVWAHRTIVEERRWLTTEEFADALSLCQFLPGPNVVNLSIHLGARFHGPLGSLVAFSGLMLAPVALVIAIGALYVRSGHTALVHAALGGVSAVAAGLLVAMGIKLAQLHGRRPMALLFGFLAFAGVGLAHLPLPGVLLVLAPLSVAAGWRWRR